MKVRSFDFLSLQRLLKLFGFQIKDRSRNASCALHEISTRGGSRCGGHSARAPLKLEKIRFFGVKS